MVDTTGQILHQPESLVTADRPQPAAPAVDTLAQDTQQWENNAETDVDVESDLPPADKLGLTSEKELPGQLPTGWARSYFIDSALL